MLSSVSLASWVRARSTASASARLAWSEPSQATRMLLNILRLPSPRLLDCSTKRRGGLFLFQQTHHDAQPRGSSNSSRFASAVRVPSPSAKEPNLSRSSSASPRSGIPYSSRSAASSPAPVDENSLRNQVPRLTTDILGVEIVGSAAG